jgi:chitin disaccharide deacetylase
MKTITLCADDFAYNADVTDGILGLIKRQRLSATSCMTNRPDWVNAAKKLLLYKDKIALGLHINLTEGTTLSGQTQLIKTNQRWIIDTFLRRANKNDIKKELRCQLDAFVKGIGTLPDFIDGHQHIHHLPIIRDALIELINDNYPQEKPHVRIAANPFLKTLRQSLDTPKAMIIALTGAWQLRKQLIKNNIPFNTSFAGIYNLLPNSPYAQLFQRFLKDVDQHGLIMCHPGELSQDSSDSIAEARASELAYFAGDGFLDCLTKVKLDLKIEIERTA